LLYKRTAYTPVVAILLVSHQDFPCHVWEDRGVERSEMTIEERFYTKNGYMKEDVTPEMIEQATNLFQQQATEVRRETARELLHTQLQELAKLREKKTLPCVAE
jgi:hypothetical protein